jgi:hypothetical protein
MVEIFRKQVVPSIVVSKMLPGKLVAITPTSLQEYTGDPS